MSQGAPLQPRPGPAAPPVATGPGAPAPGTPTGANTAVAAAAPGATKPEQFIHVRGDSDSEMEALFRVLNNKDSSLSPHHVPLAKRKLPPSFFKPPEPRPGSGGSLSRHGSNDSITFQGAGGNGSPAVTPGGLAVIHGRSLSSPAQLPHTLSAAPPPVHVKQASVDFINNNIEDLTIQQQLPAGWEVAKTTDGQRYYLK